MKYIKTFERMGIDDVVLKISDKIYKEFLLHFDKKKPHKNITEEFQVDISEFISNFSDKYNPHRNKPINISIYYSMTQSSCGISSWDTFFISIGVLNTENPSIVKTLNEIKSVITHEVKHLISLYGKYKEKDSDDKIYDSKVFKYILVEDLIGAFDDRKGNIYNHKRNIYNFLKYNRLSDNYKKLIVFLYLADREEMESILHEYYELTANKEEFKSKIDKFDIKLKDMMNFKIDISEYSEYEKNNLYKLLVNTKNPKRLEKYINNQGEKFLKKFHKLFSFL